MPIIAGMHSGQVKTLSPHKAAQKAHAGVAPSEVFIEVDFATLGESYGIGSSGAPDAQRYVTKQIMISIITPAHNEEAYLERCLASVKLAAETASVKSEHIVGMRNRDAVRFLSFMISLSKGLGSEEARRRGRHDR